MLTMTYFSGVWLFLVGTLLIVLVLVLAVTWPSIQPLPQPCDARQSPLSVSVLVNGAPQYSGVNVNRPSTTLGPIQINGDEDSVAIRAEIRPWPEGCDGAPWVDWELSFVGFSLLKVVKTSTIQPPSDQLALWLGPRRANAVGEDHVVLIVKDSTGQVGRIVSIRLRGE